MGGFGLPFSYINNHMAQNIISSCPFPANLNPLSPNGFKFSIEKLPSLTYFCQEITLPQMYLGDIMQANPLTNIALPGDQITYDLLTVDFLVDQSMHNYVAIHNWMAGLGFPQDNAQYVDLVAANAQTDLGTGAKAYSDATLQILDSMGGAIATVQFVDMVPQALEALTFTSTSNDVQYLVGRASFKYTYYKFI